MPLKNGLSPTFLQDVQELLFLVREYGTEKVGSRPATAEQFLDFVVHVHDGWKGAQKRVAELLIGALGRRDRAKADVKHKHRLKDMEGNHDRICRVLALYMSVGRRVVPLSDVEP